MDNEEFTSLVNADIRGTLDEPTSDWLRQSDNVYRFYDTLLKLKHDVDLQLTANKIEVAENRANYLQTSDEIGWQSFLASNAKWKHNAVKFKNGVDRKLVEVKRLVKAFDKDSRLEAAIREHMEAVTETDDDGFAADEKLWSLID